MYMKIHCEYCNQNYEVYERDIDSKKENQCPHCSSKIDRDIWRGVVVPAFKSAQVANWALMDDHVEHHRPLFTVTFVPDHIFPVDTE